MSREPRTVLASAMSVPAATIGANVASYALLLVAAHVLSKADYGQLSSLLGLLLIGSVPMLALQTVVARRNAGDEGMAGVVGGAVAVTAFATIVFLIAAEPLAVFLRVSVLGPLVVAATVPGVALLGAAQGRAQGRREFSRLSLLILATTGGRSIGGLVGLTLSRGVVGTLAGVFAGTALAAVLVGASQLRGHWGRDRLRTRAVVIEAAHAAQAHSGFLLLTSIDVLLARHVLDADSAGMYAVGSVVSRAALWLPQSVVTIMFASLADSQHHGRAARRTTAIVAGIGALAVAGTALLNRVLVIAIGGSKYKGLDASLWLFALLGALLALLQLFVLAGLAQRRVRRTALVWLTILADLSIVLSVGSSQTPRGLVTIFVLVTASAATVAVFSMVRNGRERIEPEPGVVPQFG